ncbi:MAG TPA: ABC transporter permease [Puia sp.]|nr:ABC transporter permease [Puia sp.]
MFTNYLKTAFRSLLKNKGFTALNVLGLTLGIATCLLIVFYVLDELSYDRYNEKADRIYRINNEIKFGGNENVYAASPAPAALAMKNDFPEVEQVVRLQGAGRIRVKKGSQYIQENHAVYADSSLFAVFTLPLIEGDAANALMAPKSVVITEQTAKKYFNRTDVVGQTLLINDNEPYKITGVIKDLPVESHFRFDFFFAISDLSASREAAWLSNNFITYVVLKPGSDPARLEAKFPGFLRKYMGPQLQDVLHLTYEGFEKGGNYYHFSLFPLTKIHLQSNSVDDLAPNGNIEYIYIFSAIALFILLIACINFMNLSTARSANRAREVGVRKVLGSPRKFLVAQFLTESVLVTLGGAGLAVILAWALLPLFNTLSGKELTISYYLISRLLPILLVFVVIIGGLAGSYPAFFLSAFQPIDVLKGKLASGFKGGRLRSTLVVFQFAISFFLITSTLVVYQQIQYIQSRDLGYNRDHVLIVQNTGTLGSQAHAFKQEVKQLPGVENATLTGELPTAENGNWTSLFEDRGLDQRRAVHSQLWSVDEDYLGTLGMKIKSGRNFSKEMPTDSSAVIVNEAAAKMLSFANPLNQSLYAPADNLLKKINTYHIIGVIKDFNFQSLRKNVTPMALTLDEDRGALSVRIHAGANIPALMAQVEDKWKGLSPNQEFAYSFMKDDFDGLYRAEQRIGKIFLAFSSLAILIACLGLFGLVAYAAEQRTREIGIRKVLGAGIATIVRMLSRDFIKLVLLAILIASPLAWLAMHKWLQGFAYPVGISVWIFIVAGLIALVIAVLTLSFQTIRAAVANPAKSLKTE